MANLTARQNSPIKPQATVDITLPTGWDGAADISPVNSAALVTALADTSTINTALASGHYIIELDKDTIYTGNYVIDNSGYGGTNWIIFRSSGFASLTAGTRVSASNANLAVVLSSDTTAVMRTEFQAHHIRFVGIEFKLDQNNGLFVLLGFDSGNLVPVVQSDMGHHVTIDRCDIHMPDENTRTTAGVLASVDSFACIESRIRNIKNTDEAQAIIIGASNGPIHIENNYLEAAGENIMSGGNELTIDKQQPQDLTILRNHFFKPDKWNRNHASFNEQPDDNNNINFISVTNTDILGREDLDGLTTITTADSNIAITAITESSGFTSIEKTTHALVVGQWLTVAGVTPSGYNTSHKVTAVTDANNVVTSIAYISNSTVHGTYRPLHARVAGEVIKLEATVPTGYRGRHSIVHKIDDDSFVTDITYTSDSSTPGTYRDLEGWEVKNIFELKMAERCHFSGNVLDGSWAQAQTGYAIVLTPGRTVNGPSTWTAVHDVLIENCVIKRAGRGLNILGDDDVQQSQQSKRLTIRNCLIHTIGGTILDALTEVFAVTGEFLAFGTKTEGRPYWDVLIDHCTLVFQEGHLGNDSFGSSNSGAIEIKNFTVSNCIFDDGKFEDFEQAFNAGEIVNLSVVNNGIFYNTGSSGYSTKIVDATFETNFNEQSWGSGNIKANTITLAKFTNNATFDYTLASDSPFKGIAADGLDAGVDFATLNAAIAGVV